MTCESFCKCEIANYLLNRNNLGKELNKELNSFYDKKCNGEGNCEEIYTYLKLARIFGVSLGVLKRNINNTGNVEKILKEIKYSKVEQK